MSEIGRIYVKIAGRDSGKKCVVVDVLDSNMVLIDGETRRRKCNIKHLEPVDEKVVLKKGASIEEVKDALKKVGIVVKEFKKKEKSDRPLRKRVLKSKVNK